MVGRKNLFCFRNHINLCAAGQGSVKGDIAAVAAHDLVHGERARVGAVLLDVLKKKAASKVKLESPADKLRNELKEKIEELNIEKDYALSDKKNPESAARVKEIDAELGELKARLKTDVAKLKAAEKAQ